MNYLSNAAEFRYIPVVYFRVLYGRCYYQPVAVVEESLCIFKQFTNIAKFFFFK